MDCGRCWPKLRKKIALELDDVQIKILNKKKKQIQQIETHKLCVAQSKIAQSNVHATAA